MSTPCARVSCVVWALALIVAGVASPAMPQENFVDPEGGAEQSRPRMGADDQGNVLAVWLDWRSGPRIRSSFRELGGNWEASVLVDPSGASSQMWPSLSIDEAGNGYAAWEDSRDNRQHVRFAYRPAGGDWGMSEVVSAATVRQIRPAMAGNRQGALVVAWTQDAGGGQYDVYAAVRPAGGPWGPAARVTDTAGSWHTISVAVDASGGAYGLWEDDREGSRDLYFSTRQPSGVWTANVKVNDDTTPTPSDPDLVVDDDGNLYAVWTAGSDIYADYRPAGGSWGQDVRVNDDTGSAMQHDASLAILPGNYAVAVWVDERDPLASIYAAARPAGGNWGANVLIHAWVPPPGLDYGADTAVDPMSEGRVADPRMCLLTPMTMFVYYAAVIEDVMDAPTFVAYYITALLVMLDVIPDEAFIQTGDIQPFTAMLTNVFGHAYGGRDPLDPTWTATGGDLSNTTGFSTEYTAQDVGDHLVTATVSFEIDGDASRQMACPRLTTVLSDTAIVHVSASADLLDGSPTAFALSRNYPNPFSTRTMVEFGVLEPCRVILSIYDLNGHEIATLLDEEHAPGTYRIEVERGTLRAGAYLCRIQMGAFSATRTMIVAQ